MVFGDAPAELVWDVGSSRLIRGVAIFMSRKLKAILPVSAEGIPAKGTTPKKSLAPKGRTCVVSNSQESGLTMQDLLVQVRTAVDRQRICCLDQTQHPRDAFRIVYGSPWMRCRMECEQAGSVQQ